MSDKLNSEEIAGLAQASPVFGALLKEAAGNTFNEDVPATQAPPGGGDGGTGYPANNAPAGVVPPGQPQGEEYAAVPQEGEMPPEEAPAEDTPEAVGARAAQAFLGPIMDGAMQGDPNAQSIVAQAAGSVAGSVADSYAKSQSAGAAGGMPGQEMAPPAMTSPEEDMANQIVQQPAAPVPGQQPPGQQPPQEGEDTEGEEELDENGKPKKKKNPPFPPKQ